MIIIYVFNLITFEIIQIIEDVLLYILTLKFLINYGNEKKNNIIRIILILYYYYIFIFFKIY